MRCERTNCPNIGPYNTVPCPVCENFSSSNSPYPAHVPFKTTPSQLDRIEKEVDDMWAAVHGLPDDIKRIEAILSKIADQSLRQADSHLKLVDTVLRLESKLDKLLEDRE